MYGPAFPNGGDYAAPRLATRSGSTCRWSPTRAEAGWAHGRSGEGTTTLLRDGEVVDEQPSRAAACFKLGAGTCAVHAAHDRDQSALARLSTQVSAEWTFTSEHVAGRSPPHMPLLAVRFAPELDDHNAAPAGKRFTIPVYVERNGAAEPAG